MRFFPLAPLLALSGGCGSPAADPGPVPVRGTVTLDTAPLADGQVSFITPGQVPETLAVRAGAFEGSVRPGTRRVEVAVYRPYRIPADAPKELHGLMAGGKENYLPDRYHTKSTLTAEVRPDGPNEFRFDILSK
ncbi:MAG: hypothetical protein C0501_24860 [Isosphaera sp.]|nr:hypothetical protein [Isosphaera sp.]